MKRTNTLIIGAGQCGLTMGRELAENSIDHVILDARTTASSWQFDRWDSLTMLTPNWMNSLNGLSPEGYDPDGFMPARQMAPLMRNFASRTGLNISENTRVLSVRADGVGYVVQTDQGAMAAQNVVIATGACATSKLPEFSAGLPLFQTTSKTYKRPTDLPEGGVLVVGASASGLNIARELLADGRDVTLSVGSHMRLPRAYRGADICTWMHLVGSFDEEPGSPDEAERLRRLPSLPLVGNSQNESVDLNSLQHKGCQLVGRLCAASGGTAYFSGSLANACTSADLKMNRLLDRIDGWIGEAGLADLVDPASRPTPTQVPIRPELQIKLRDRGISSVVWATGYQPDHSFLDLPVLRSQRPHHS